MTIADEDCAAGYLADMKKPIEDGMTMAISNWGDIGQDMSWLDGDTGCKESCGNNPSVTVSNIVYKTVNPSGPTPFQKPCPPPDPYAYGNPCATKDADDCGENCTLANCDFSWPVNDPAKWNSKDAKCRCKPSDDVAPTFI